MCIPSLSLQVIVFHEKTGANKGGFHTGLTVSLQWPGVGTEIIA
jgi:hypothetical protein